MKKLTVSIGHTETILGWIYLGLQIIVIPIALVIINSLLPRPFSDAELNFLSFAINFICITVIFHQYLLKCLKVFLNEPGLTLTNCLKGFGIYWLSSILVNYLVISLDPQFSNVNDENIAVLTGDSNLLMFVGTVLLVPTVEETLYRGLVFGNLYRKQPIIAYVLSVTIFAALHILGYIGMYPLPRLLLCFLQYIPAGITLAWTYVQTGTIWAPILIHMTVNLIGMLAMQ